MGAELVEFRRPEPKERPEEEEPTTGRAPAKCLNCEYEWSHIAQVGEVWFTCPACGALKGRHMLPWGHQLGDEGFFCLHCRSEYFFIARHGVFCGGCGVQQFPFDDPGRRA